MLIFIYREWFREWRTPIDMLLKVPGAAIGFGAKAVRTVGGKVTEILPGEQLRLAAVSGGAELKEEVGSLFTALREGVNEENAWQDEETRRRLQARLERRPSDRSRGRPRRSRRPLLLYAVRARRVAGSSA